MIRISVLYPNQPDGRFDMDYYATRHMPMVKELCGAACLAVSAERGVSGRTPDSPPTYIAIGHVVLDSLAAYQSAFLPHRATFAADIPNYTDITPIVQISEVTL